MGIGLETKKQKKQQQHDESSTTSQNNSVNVETKRISGPSTCFPGRVVVSPQVNVGETGETATTTHERNVTREEPIIVNNNYNTSSTPPSHARMATYSEPVPGLFLYEDFITQEEEIEILAQLEDGTNQHQHNWKPSQFNGRHYGKRWGVHCNLRDRRVHAAEHELPHFVTHIVLPKLQQLLLRPSTTSSGTIAAAAAANALKNWKPNEANAIDYRRIDGHFLVAHVDDRQLSKEVIANLSLAGDCFMTFTNVSPPRRQQRDQHMSSGQQPQLQKQQQLHRVLLNRRCLQILTGPARYNYSHGIAHADLLSERRVSVTMRESPLSASMGLQQQQLDGRAYFSVAQPTAIPFVPADRTFRQKQQPIPGLFLFPNFISIEEEMLILNELDDKCNDGINGQPRWSSERHTGLHREKRWGVDHDLWSRSVRPPKHDLPDWMRTILLPRLKLLPCMKECIPNEVNAIEYRRTLGHSLTLHVDDRKKHKEPIANLSLAGDCCMTYTMVGTTGSSSRGGGGGEDCRKVPLPRRTLQVLTGTARYNYSHGIANADLHSDRRVSLTMRETP